MNGNKSLVLIYNEIILFLVGIYLFKANNKNTRKRCEMYPKLTKNPLKNGRLQDIPDSDIHSSFYHLVRKVNLVVAKLTVMLNFKFL